MISLHYSGVLHLQVAMRLFLKCFVLFITVCYCSTSSQVSSIISVPPVDTIGCYGGLSTFYCESNRTDISNMHWTMDGSTLSDDEAQSRGLSIDTTCTVDSNYSCLFLRIIGSKVNNNIKFGCVFAIENNGLVDIAPAQFTILDTLPAVENLTCVDNSLSMNCSWSEPFCKPINYSYTFIAYNNSGGISLQENLTNTQVYMNTTPCSNYTLNVFVVNIAEPSVQSNSSTVTVISGFNEKDISFSFLQDQFSISFSSISERSISIVYEFSSTVLAIVSNCPSTQLLQLLPIPRIPNRFKNSSVPKEDFFQSYDESTGIGSYTIGPFNESFIGNYTLMLMNLTSMETVSLATLEISTFHVQEAHISQLSNGSTKIECGFAINSSADGCSVVFVNTQSHDQIEPLFISKRSNEDTAVMNTAISPDSGEYSISVYDVIDGVTQASTSAVTLYTSIDPTISGPDTSDEVSPSLLTPVSELVNSGTVSSLVSVTPSITLTIIPTQWTPTLGLISVSVSVILVLIVTTSIFLGLIRRRILNHHKITLNSEFAMTQIPTADSNTYSKLPPATQNNAAVPIQGQCEKCVEKYAELNMFMSADRPSENNKTVIDDDNINARHQTQASSHYENVHVHPQQEETHSQEVQVHDLPEDDEGHSHNDVQSSIHSSVTDKEVIHDLPEDDEGYSHSVASSSDDDASHMRLNHSKYAELPETQSYWDDHNMTVLAFHIGNDDSLDEVPLSKTKYRAEVDKVNGLDKEIATKDNFDVLANGHELVEFKLSSVMIHGAPGACETTLSELISGMDFKSSTTNAIEEFANSDKASGFRVLGDNDVLPDSIESYVDNERRSPFIQVYDCSGQPHHADLFQLVYRNPPLLNIVVVRLIDNLDDKPRVYTEDGGCHQLNCLTNSEYIIRMCQIASNPQYLTAEGVVPHVMIVGTHYDKLGESADAVLQEFNEALRSIQKEFGHVLISKSEDETIFPINAMATGDELGEYIAQIQECISTAIKECSPVEVPFKWLSIQAEIKRRKGVIVRMTDCYQIGNALEMDLNDVEKAFQFFNEMGVILYVPDDIPDFIVAKIHPLIERVASLFTAPLLSNELLDESKKLCASGLFNKSYVGKILETDELSEEEFLEVLECLKIVACVGHGEYFFPSALSFESTIDKASQVKMSCYPLIFNWGEGFLQDGFFHVVVNELLSCKENGKYKFELCPDVPQWRGEIQIRETTGKISGVIKLKNKMKWIQVSSTTDNTKEDCPIIYGEVYAAIQRMLRKFKHMGIDQPTVTTLCLLCPSTQEDHCCILSTDKVMCSIDCNITGCVTEDISCWFKGHESIPYYDSVQHDSFLQTINIAGTFGKPK